MVRRCTHLFRYLLLAVTNLIAVTRTSIIILLAISCEELESPRRGSVSFSDNSNVGSIANYSCDVGFVIVGGSQRICLDTGMWTGEAPNCTITSGKLRRLVYFICCNSIPFSSLALVTTPVTDEITTTASPCPADLDLDCELKTGTRKRIESRLDDTGNSFEECRANCVDAFDRTPKKRRNRERGRARSLNRIIENCECYCSRFCPEAQSSSDGMSYNNYFSDS